MKNDSDIKKMVSQDFKNYKLDEYYITWLWVNRIQNNLYTLQKKKFGETKEAYGK